MIRISTLRACQRALQSKPNARSMSIYAAGDGWTGALTRDYVLETVDGHFDEDSNDRNAPVLIYPHDDVQQIAAGWGNSAYLDTKGQVHLVGRPHDLMNLLRLNRLPAFVRQWANQRLDPSETTYIGSLISRAIGFASGVDEEDTWGVAQQHSLLHDWTPVDFKEIGDSEMSQICCSSGFMAMIGTSGTLYTLGVNNRGQCGTGSASNNVWTPTPVAGITTSKSQQSNQAEQEEPIVQVALGFQQGYALSKFGHVYTWGKANRGQLGRKIESDQDPSARPIQFEGLATQVASGMHHGALLGADNLVYIWGKNMARPDSESKKAQDALAPQPVEGLPEEKVVKIACGSHHTAILLEDGSVYAVGIASDEAVPLLDPVELAAPGTLEMPLKQFDAHHDRTTMIDKDGQVLQAHLWKDERLRDYALFTPGFVDALLDEGEEVESIQRGWLHTLMLTKPSGSQ